MSTRGLASVPGWRPFKTRNLQKRRLFLEGKGAPELERAEFEGGNGRYACFDSVPQLGVQIELLE